MEYNKLPEEQDMDKARSLAFAASKAIERMVDYDVAYVNGYSTILKAIAQVEATHYRRSRDGYRMDEVPLPGLED